MYVFTPYSNHSGRRVIFVERWRVPSGCVRAGLADCYLFFDGPPLVRRGHRQSHYSCPESHG